MKKYPINFLSLQMLNTFFKIHLTSNLAGSCRIPSVSCLECRPGLLIDYFGAMDLNDLIFKRLVNIWKEVIFQLLINVTYIFPNLAYTTYQESNSQAHILGEGDTSPAFKIKSVFERQLPQKSPIRSKMFKYALLQDLYLLPYPHTRCFLIVSYSINFHNDNVYQTSL